MKSSPAAKYSDQEKDEPVFLKLDQEDDKTDLGSLEDSFEQVQLNTEASRIEFIYSLLQSEKFSGIGLDHLKLIANNTNHFKKADYLKLIEQAKILAKQDNNNSVSGKSVILPKHLNLATVLHVKYNGLMSVQIRKQLIEFYAKQFNVDLTVTLIERFTKQAEKLTKLKIQEIFILAKIEAQLRKEPISVATIEHVSDLKLQIYEDANELAEIAMNDCRVPPLFSLSLCDYSELISILLNSLKKDPDNKEFLSMQNIDDNIYDPTIFLKKFPLDCLNIFQADLLLKIVIMYNKQRFLDLKDCLIHNLDKQYHAAITQTKSPKELLYNDELTKLIEANENIEISSIDKLQKKLSRDYAKQHEFANGLIKRILSKILSMKHREVIMKYYQHRYNDYIEMVLIDPTENFVEEKVEEKVSQGANIQQLVALEAQLAGLRNRAEQLTAKQNT